MVRSQDKKWKKALERFYLSKQWTRDGEWAYIKEYLLAFDVCELK